MKKTIIFCLLFVCLNKINAQNSTTATPDEANTDFQHKFQDSSKMKAGKMKNNKQSNANRNAPDEANTDFQHQFQDSARQSHASKTKGMKHDHMNSDSSNSMKMRKNKTPEKSASDPQ